MVRKTQRLLLLVICCSITGVILGGTAAWAESNLCLEDSKVTSDCVTQESNPKNYPRNEYGIVSRGWGRLWCSMAVKA